MGIGAAGSWQVRTSAVAKCNSGNVPYCIPNELICAELGRFVGLPIPPAGIIHSPNAPTPLWFASLDFNLTGNTLPPVDAARCCAELTDLSTGLLLFDIWISNSDRHAANFSVDFLANPVQMSVFDHGHALFGNNAGQGEARLRELRNRLGASGGSRTHGSRHCLLDVLSTDAYFSKWLDRIGQVPDYVIEDVCRDAVGLGITASEAATGIDFLTFRRGQLRRIIDAARNEFRRIQQWGLFT
jgi:hypothetical protein